MFPCSGDPLYVGFDLTIASFDSISEVSMVSILAQYANTSAYISFPHKYHTLQSLYDLFIYLPSFQDYTITMYLNQYWKDERLAFSSEENKVLTLSGDFAEKIWVPDTFFANDKKR